MLFAAAPHSLRSSFASLPAPRKNAINTPINKKKHHKTTSNSRDVRRAHADDAADARAAVRRRRGARRGGPRAGGLGAARAELPAARAAAAAARVQGARVCVRARASFPFLCSEGTGGAHLRSLRDKFSASAATAELTTTQRQRQHTYHQPLHRRRSTCSPPRLLPPAPTASRSTRCSCWWPSCARTATRRACCLST